MYLSTYEHCYTVPIHTDWLSYQLITMGVTFINLSLRISIPHGKVSSTFFRRPWLPCLVFHYGLVHQYHSGAWWVGMP